MVYQPHPVALVHATHAASLLGERFMQRMMRLGVLSFLCTSALVLVGAVHERTRNPAVGFMARAQSAEAAQHMVHAEVSTQAEPLQASLRVEPLGPPPAAGPAPLVELGEMFPADDPGAWTAPAWFPEATHERLLSLDHIGDGPANHGPRMRLHSKAAFVYDLDTGEVLLSKAADERRPVASLTKLVSGLTVASEAPELDDTICLDTSMRPSWPGAVTRLRTGTCATGWDLLGAALVRSDNGAAYALPAVAQLHHSHFVVRMNGVASELGMSLSTFSDPSGVEDDNLSTARDMTRAVVAASLHPTVQTVASAPYWDVFDQTRERRRRLLTTNKLISRRNTEVVAAKTGYTDTARHCFAGVFELDDGRRVAVTTLGAWSSRRRWRDVRALLSWVERAG